jgi:hypothetical protein
MANITTLTFLIIIKSKIKSFGRFLSYTSFYVGSVIKSGMKNVGSGMEKCSDPG